MKKYIFPFGFLLLFAATSCEKSSSNTLEFETLNFNKLCGWCVHGDALNINSTDNTAHFNIYDPCDLTNPVSTDQRSLTDQEITRINDAFDEIEFLSVAIAQCGECYDGCEDRIELFKNGDLVHTLQFDNLDYPSLDPVQDLIDVLTEIRDSF